MKLAINISREDWQLLWESLGQRGLLRLVRSSEEFDSRDDEQVVDELVRRSLTAGYDPVSGFFGTWSEAENTFELEGK